LSRTLRLSQYQKGYNNLDFIEARDTEWQWRQLTSLQTDHHASTPPINFLQAERPSCHPANSIEGTLTYKVLGKILCNILERLEGI